MVIRDVCPQCKSPKHKKNGHVHNGKQNHQYQDCGRQFVACFAQYRIADDTRALIERLLVERISLRGICRAVGVGLKWLLGFLVRCIKALPDHLPIQPVAYNQNVMIQRLEVEADEMASFVQSKATTHTIECNHCRQRHWFGRFKRKSIIISKSKEMVELTMALFAKFWVNGNQDELISLLD